MEQRISHDGLILCFWFLESLRSAFFISEFGNSFEALHDVSLTIENGEMVAIIGKSGAGKSTLLHILACIDSYEDGEYQIGNTIVVNFLYSDYILKCFLLLIHADTKSERFDSISTIHYHTSKRSLLYKNAQSI